MKGIFLQKLNYNLYAINTARYQNSEMKMQNSQSIGDKMSEFTTRMNKEEIERMYQQIDSLCFLSSDRNGSIRSVIYFLAKRWLQN